ncbi:MAG TPA: energy transducer TonB [Elusimicrobiota bacterium]|jgi:TonB family protein|nr:energy transducer TonB [Elusimicrobiota bacterium]
MTAAKLPTSVVISLGLHGGALVLFGLMLREAPRQAPQIVEGVQLLTEAPKPRAQAESAPKPPPLSTMDFLKLALPSTPHAAAPEQLTLKIPEHKIALADAPKLEDRAHRSLPKLQALDLGRRPDEAAKLEDVKIEDRRQAAETLAALPRLEDVGRRRIKNLPQALELEDRRREAVEEQGLPDVALKATSRRRALAAVSILKEAAPPEEESRPKLGSLLPERPLLMEAHPQAAMAPKLEKIAALPKPARRTAQAAAAGKAKGVQIEGPLADRRISAYSVPSFPSWARDQGILEADVGIRFTVDEDGNVMDDMRVENSSGYGRLDKLAMEYLKNWRFAPKPGAGVEWGLITFKFVLE